MKIGDRNISNIKLGTSDISKVMLGSNLEWTREVPFSFGQAADFGALDRLSSITTYTLSTTDWTISYWINCASYSSLKYCTYTDSSHYTYIASSTSVRLRLSSNKIFTLGTALSVNEWHNLVFANRGGTLRLYVDGVESSTGGIAISSAVKFSDIGKSTSSINGKMDELGVTNGYGATLADAQALYNGGAGADYASVITDSTPLVHMSFDGDVSNKGSGADDFTNFGVTFTSH